MPTTRSGRSSISSSAMTAPRGVEHSDVLLHQDRIAVPPEIAGVKLEQAVAVLADLVEHPFVSDAEMNRLVGAVAIDQLMRHRRPASADAFVGFLQGDDVGVDFLQDIKHALRIAPPVEADGFAHIVAGQGNRRA